MIHLLVIAKEPVPGRVKTRLTPPFTPVQAAMLAEASLADTLDTVAATPAWRRTLALAGKPGPWLPGTVEVIPQRGDGLDERLANAFADASAPFRGAISSPGETSGRTAPYGGPPLALIGMDTPQVTPELLTSAASALRNADAVLGPAADGGFWLLGLRRPDPGLLLGVPMSRPDTGARQVSRLRDNDLRVAFLPVLTDVDTAFSAAVVAAQAPYGRFAAAVTRILPTIRGEPLMAT